MIVEQWLLDRRREKKLKKSFEDAEKTRPMYQIPGELKANRDMAYREANYGEVPGSSQARDRNDIAAANSLAAAAGAGNVMAAVPGVQAAKAAADLNVANANASYRKENLGMLYAANNQLANAKDTQFQLNKFAPWADKFQMNNNLIELGHQRWSNANEAYGKLAMQVAGAAMGAPTGGGGSFFGGGGGGDQNMSFRDAMGR